MFYLVKIADQFGKSKFELELASCSLAACHCGTELVRLISGVPKISDFTHAFMSMGSMDEWLMDAPKGVSIKLDSRTGMSGCRDYFADIYNDHGFHIRKYTVHVSMHGRLNAGLEIPGWLFAIFIKRFDLKPNYPANVRIIRALDTIPGDPIEQVVVDCMENPPDQLPITLLP